LTDAGGAAFQWNDASAVDALHHAGPVRIADHPADQIDRGPYSFRLGHSRTGLQKALRRLCDERRAVGQPARCVARSSARRGSGGGAGTIIAVTSQRNCNQNDGCGNARCDGGDETTAALKVAGQNAQTKRDQDQHNRMSNWPWDRGNPGQ
jgi:hypothetical protein